MWLVLFELFEEMGAVGLYGGLHKNNYAFHFTFFKNVSVSFVVSLTINRDITFHKRATVHIWFIEP